MDGAPDVAFIRWTLHAEREDLYKLWIGAQNMDFALKKCCLGSRAPAEADSDLLTSCSVVYNLTTVLSARARSGPQ